MRIPHKWGGWAFVLAILLSISAGPLFLGGKNKYDVPEPKALSAEDEAFLTVAVDPYCDQGYPHQLWPVTAPRQSVEVPVFLYHRVTDVDPPSHEVIAPELFEEHMKVLKERGYQTISSSELSAFMLGKGTLPPKPVMLTFDDGWKDNMEAAKVLEKYGFGATFYVISGFFGAPLYFDEDDVLTLIKNPKFEIGSHMHTHFTKFQRQLTTLPLCTMAREMAISKRILERLTKKPVKSLAWPYGYNTPQALFVAEKLGYESTGLVSRDAINAQGHSPLFTRRINIDGTCPIAVFKEMLDTKLLKECS